MTERFTDDGLLPPADPWLADQPPRSFGEDPIATALRAVGDARLLAEVVWPARQDDRLVEPPAAHLLDHLVREHVLPYAPEHVRAAADLRPRAFTIAAVDQLPRCDDCAVADARYDVDAHGWRMLCRDCFAAADVRLLGIGRGQYLTTWAEVTPEVLHALRRAKATWQARGVDVPLHDPWP